MIDSLFHITHRANLPGILRNGLLCRHQIETQQISYHDLSDPGCQARRTHRRLGSSCVNLHDYVPLFINPRNPMLYRLERSLQEQGRPEDLVILELDAEPAGSPGSLLSDGIASSSASTLYRASDPAGWAALDWEAIRCCSWVDAPEGTGRRKMAEVLVPTALEPRHIRKVWMLREPSLLTGVALALVTGSHPGWEVDSERRLFFR